MNFILDKNSIAFHDSGIESSLEWKRSPNRVVCRAIIQKHSKIGAMRVVGSPSRKHHFHLFQSWEIAQSKSRAPPQKIRLVIAQISLESIASYPSSFVIAASWLFISLRNIDYSRTSLSELER